MQAHVPELYGRIQAAERLLAFVAEGNAHVHPGNWSPVSAAKAMARCKAPAAHMNTA